MKSKKEEKSSQTKRRSSPKSKYFLIALSILAIISAGYFYKKYQNALDNPQAQISQKNNKETEEVVSSLGKIIALPTDKQPTVAKVQDVDKLKKSNQTFYKDVAKDDYLVLYSDRAIIFRKKENKVINIAPIVDTSQIQTSQENQ